MARASAMLALVLGGACGRIGYDGAPSSGGDGRPGVPPDAFVADVLAPCTLATSPPVIVTADGQVIENVRIAASGQPAIQASGYRDVVIRNVEIEHAGANGIELVMAESATVEGVSIVRTDVPSAGPAPVILYNIRVEDSLNVTIRHARLQGGTSGVSLLMSRGAFLHDIEGHDIRGEFLVDFQQGSDDGWIQDFSVENPLATAYAIGGVQALGSARLYIERGLIDGQNDPSGGGIMALDDGIEVIDVDVVRATNACFNAWIGTNVTFTRTRCFDMVCADQGYGLPASGGTGWVGGGVAAQHLIVRESTHAIDLSICTQLFWPDTAFDVLDLAPVTTFTPRPPLRLAFCWQ